MLNLMKYELFRRKRLLITSLIIFLFLELGIWLGMVLKGNWYIMSITFLMILFVGGLAFPFIDAVVNYFSDFKSKNGYMLFLTPSSGYKIVGAKVVLLAVELLIMGALIFAALRLDFEVLKTSYPDVINTITGEMFAPLTEALGLEKITFWTLSPILLVGFMQYVTNVLIALFAITIAKTLLSSKDFNWLLALVFYFAVYTLVQLLNFAVLAAFGVVGEIINLAAVQSSDIPNVKRYLMAGLGLYAVLIAALLPLSGLLLNKRTDL